MKCPPSCVATDCTSKPVGSATSVADHVSRLSNRIPQSMMVPTGYVTPGGPGKGIADPPSTGITVFPAASVVVVGASSTQQGVTARVPPGNSGCQATRFTPSSANASVTVVCPRKCTTGTSGSSGTPSSTLSHVLKLDSMAASNAAWLKLPGIPDGLWDQRIAPAKPGVPSNKRESQTASWIWPPIS